MSDSLRGRIAAAITAGVIAGRGHGDIADAVIAELEPLRQQLLAYARSGVKHGDMTPTSERVLHRILAHYWKADDE